MSTFDEMFPNPLDCYLTLFQDAIFEQSPDMSYVLEKGQFKRRNRTEVLRKIVNLSQVLYSSMIKKVPFFSQCKPHYDQSALLGVVSRYSRDIYGFRRIKAKLENLERVVGNTANFKTELEDIILESADFGFIIPSSAPYIHRQASVLLYWFSVLKPFHLEITSNQGPFPEKHMIYYFNEYFAYSLINIALHAYSYELSVHKDKLYFKDEFLNQLHFRNLSRSSLEFFLPNWENNPS
jgi:hypothetical protein